MSVSPRTDAQTGQIFKTMAKKLRSYPIAIAGLAILGILILMLHHTVLPTINITELIYLFFLVILALACHLGLTLERLRNDTLGGNEYEAPEIITEATQQKRG